MSYIRTNDTYINTKLDLMALVRVLGLVGDVDSMKVYTTLFAMIFGIPSYWYTVELELNNGAHARHEFYF